MSVSPSILSIAQCLVARVKHNSMYLSMKLLSEKQGIEIVEEGLLDSGAMEKFIDQNFVKQKGLITNYLTNQSKSSM